MHVHVYDLLLRKRNGDELSHNEIHFLVDQFVRGNIPDYQMAALLMAIYFQGMTAGETLALTEAMIASGDTVSFPGFPGPIVDKHSTGGVGDKTTLVLVPLVAAAGLPVVKMSGRGLGHTGGTLDKLAAFPGMTTDLAPDQMAKIVREAGAVIAGQTANITPADKALYALRDVTGTVESMPLIAASIMSKKLAAGADKIVLDVKYGSGAFMKNRTDAEQLARLMVQLARDAGKEAVALVTDMNQPLGHMIGNSLEVQEAVAALRGQGPPDLIELVLALGTEMLCLARPALDHREARSKLGAILQSGEAVRVLQNVVAASGGDPRAVTDAALLPQAPYTADVAAPRTGYIKSIDTEAVGRVALELGAGRKSLADQIDLAVGLKLEAKIGTQWDRGAVIGRVFARSAEAAVAGAEAVLQTLQWSDTPVPKPPLIAATIVAS